MAYCPRCGVEVEERLEACPLCDTTIPSEVRGKQDLEAEFPESVILPSPVYRTLDEGQKRTLAALLVGFLAFFPVVLSVGLDFSSSSTVTWSYYVAVPVLGAAVAGWLIFLFRRRPLMAASSLLVLILAVEILIELRLRDGNLLTSPVLPYFLVSFLAVELYLLYATSRRRGVVMLIAVALVITSLLLLAVDLISQQDLSWSLVAASTTLPAALFLIYLAQVRRKGINVAGFFFLDLTMMLIALDLSIGDGIGWSVVTTLIFMTLAILFYVLHVALFNDVDWRKALHL